MRPGVRCRASGKLVLAGEYAVLFPGGRGLVAGVDAGVYARVDRRVPSCTCSGVSLCAEWSEPHLGGSSRAPLPLTRSPIRSFPDESPRDAYVEAALREAESILGRDALEPLALEPFALEIGAYGPDEVVRPPVGRKPGIGMSSAVVVAVLAAVLRAHDLEPALGDVLAAAIAAHRVAQGGSGSGIDVAAAVYGGVCRLEQVGSVPWVERVPWPSDWWIGAIAVGSASSTPDRVQRVLKEQANQPVFFRRFVEATADVVSGIEHAMRAGDFGALASAVREQRRWLLELGERCSLPMETPPMARLIDQLSGVGVAKQSGAGGGDCLVVFLNRREAIPWVCQCALEAAMTVLPLSAPGGGLTSDMGGG